ncbi:MAG: hypothetical protein GX224_02690 [Thermoplasmatales archaeon]|nr:hypothetical protein [Thermoplasmatales archaeon]
MVVKEKRGRRRYVALELVDGVPKTDLQSVGSKAGLFRVIQHGNGWAIVRCGHTAVGDAVAAIQAAFPGTRPRATSGTLRALRRRFPPLSRDAGRTIEHK